MFAVPGAVGNPLSRGCHALLRQGAKLIESVADLAEELPVLRAALAHTVDSPPATAGGSAAWTVPPASCSISVGGRLAASTTSRCVVD